MKSYKEFMSFLAIPRNPIALLINTMIMALVYFEFMRSGYVLMHGVTAENLRSVDFVLTFLPILLFIHAAIEVLLIVRYVKNVSYNFWQMDEARIFTYLFPLAILASIILCSVTIGFQQGVAWTLWMSLTYGFIATGLIVFLFTIPMMGSWLVLQYKQRQ